MTYKTIEYTVKAWKFKGNLDDAPNWILDAMVKGFIPSYQRDFCMVISTPNGGESVKAGDYLVHNPSDGSITRFPSTVFEALFTEAEEKQI